VSYNTPEGKVKRRVVEVLKKHGVWYFFPANNGFGVAGIPDIIAVVKGQFLGIEVKADRTKKPTELQLQCGAKIQSAGGWWMVVYDQDSLDMLSVMIEEKLYR
jgi:hypothetical protein